MKCIPARFLLFLFSFVFTCTYAQEKVVYLTKDSLKQNVITTGKWLYRQGDNRHWANTNINDSGWRYLNDTWLNSWLEDSVDKVKFNGIGWFRLHIYTDSATSKIPLALGIFQSGASEIFLDGEKIGGYGTIGKSAADSRYATPAYAPLIFNIGASGQHVIAIRYANYRATTGKVNEMMESVGFDVIIHKANVLSQRYAQNIIYGGIIYMSLAGLFFALAVVHFVLWLYNKKDYSNLYFSLFALSMSIFGFTTHWQDLPQDMDVYFKVSYINFASVLIIFTCLSGLTNYLFSKKKISFYIIAACCLLMLGMLFAGVTENTVVAMLLIFWFVVVIETLVLTIAAMYRRQKGATIVGTGVLLFVVLLLIILITLFIAIEIEGDITVDSSTTRGIIVIILSLAAVLSIPFSMSVYLAMNFATINKTIVKQEQEKQQILETQNERLEAEVKERTQEITSEKQKSDELLRNILPEEIAEELKLKGSSTARYYDNVSVIFTDFVDFTKAGMRLTPQQLVSELDTCFKAFDEITAKYNIEKIKTIGDAYLAVCGLPTADTDHAVKTVNAALDIMSFMRERKKQYPDTTFDIRIGIHSGTVVAGIVGLKKFAYDIWGDTVNTAARMESSGEANRINISQTTFDLVQHEFICTYRGEIMAKNKGDMHMYFVEGKR